MMKYLNLSDFISKNPLILNKNGNINNGAPLHLKEQYYSILLVELNFKLLNEFNGFAKKHKHKCLSENCLHLWDVPPSVLIKKKKCPECSRKQNKKLHELEAEKIKYISIEHLIKENPRFLTKSGKPSPSAPLVLRSQYYQLQIKDKNVEIKEEFLGYARKIEHYCLDDKCNHSWKVSPNKFLKGTGCPSCANRRRRSSHEDYIDWLRKRKPTIQCLGRYIKGETAIRHKCLLKNCNHEWVIEPAKIKSGYGCPNCSYERHYNSESYREWLKIYKPTIQFVGEISTGSKKVLHRCLVDGCGYEWMVQPASIKQGYGCTRCAGLEKGSTSSFKKWLQNNRPEINLIGEYISSSTRAEFSCLKEGCGYTWITTPSSIKSGRGCSRCAKREPRNTESWQKWLSNNRPHLELLGDYTKSVDPILHRCNRDNCGYEWLVSPGHISSHNSDCPKCQGTAKVSHDEYVDWIKSNRPNIKVIESYLGNKKPILHQCQANSCGHQWKAKPNNIKSNNSGCPKCCEIGTDADMLYYWIDDNGYTKIGITSTRIGRERIDMLARKRGTSASNVRMVEVGFGNAWKIEAELHRKYGESPYSSDTGDGYSEFRDLSKDELKELDAYFDNLELISTTNN